MAKMLRYNKYPRNWRKVTKVIRRLANNQCELCGAPGHSVHHVGASFECGLPGNKRDKHDIRKCNLQLLCYSCHDRLDNGALTFYARLRARGKNKRAAHRSLNIGTGLVPLRPIRLTSEYWMVATVLHYARLRYSKRSGNNAYRSFVAPVIQPRIVESYLVCL